MLRKFCNLIIVVAVAVAILSNIDLTNRAQLGMSGMPHSCRAESPSHEHEWGDELEATHESGTWVISIDRRCTQSSLGLKHTCWLRVDPEKSSTARPSIDVRAAGPSLVSVHWQFCTSKQHHHLYELSFDVVDPGAYEVLIILTFEDFEHSFPSPPLRQHPCLCKEFRKIITFEPLYIELKGQAASTSKPCYLDGPIPRGRWIEKHQPGFGRVHHRGKYWQWETTCQMPDLGQTQGRIPLCSSFLLFGDSHFSSWMESLVFFRNRDWGGMPSIQSGKLPQNDPIGMHVSILGLSEVVLGEGYHRIDNQSRNEELHQSYWLNMSIRPQKTHIFLDALSKLTFPAFSRDPDTGLRSRNPLVHPGHGPTALRWLTTPAWEHVRKKDWLKSAESINEDYDLFRVTLSRYQVVVVNSGHWDLRDGSVDDFISEVTILFATLRSVLGSWPGRKVWRTIPPFAHKGSHAATNNPFASSREYRTNEKIDEANIRATALAVQHGFIVHDSHYIMRPMWDIPCDTHHYLCGNQNDPGIADLQLFSLIHGQCIS